MANNETLIKFHCPHCDHKIEAEARLGGANFPCPSCGKTLVIPARTIGPGIVLGGYRLERLLGKGGMGEVYLAQQVAMERKVAVKVLAPDLVRDEEYVGRFMNEVRLLARLDHPHIVTAIDAGQEGGTYFLAMSYVDGRPLAERLDEGEVLKEPEAVNTVLKMANALSYAWDKHRLLHRDIKPSNILIDSDGEPKLTDLGVSKSMSQPEKSLTMTGMVVGTPYYMSPEQARGDAKLDFHADLYSLGATFYHMVTGEVPFEGETSMAIISKVLTEPLPNPKKIAPMLSYGCAQVIRAMTEKSPEDRYGEWDELITDLRLVLRGKPPQHAPGILRRAKIRRRRQQVPNSETFTDGLEAPPPPPSRSVGALVAIMLALVLAVLGLLLLILRPPQPPQTVSSPDVPISDPVLPAVPTADTTPVEPIPIVEVDPPPALPDPTVATDPTEPPLEALPTAAEERLMQLEKMYGYADDYALNNPDDFDGAIVKFRQVAEDAAGTEIRLRANDRIAELEGAREAAIDEVMGQLAAAAKPLLGAYQYAEAMDLYRRYNGPLKDITDKHRRRVLKGIEQKSQDHAQQLVTQKADAEREFVALRDQIARDLVNLDLGRPTERVFEMRKLEMSAMVADSLNALAASLDEIGMIQTRILASLREDIGKEATLELRDGKVKMAITAVEGGEIRGNLIVDEFTGTIGRTVKLTELAPKERLRRLGEGEGADLQIMRAIVTLSARRQDPANAAKYLEAARAYLVTANTDLARAMIAVLDERQEQAAQEAVDKAFGELLKMARLVREEGSTPQTLIASLAAGTYTRTEADAIRKGAVELVRRYPTSSLVNDYAMLLSAMAELTAVVWPGKHELPVLIWDVASANNRLVEPDTGKLARCTAVPEGEAKFVDGQQMRTAGGAFFMREAEAPLLAALKATSELTLEVTLRPAPGDQSGPARIVSFSSSSMSRNFTLGQEGRDLVWRLRTSNSSENGTMGRELVLARLEGDEPVHVLITYKAGITRCFVDGKQVLESETFSGDFSNWQPMRLVLGNEASMDRAWQGELRGLCIHARAMPPEEAAAQASLYRKRTAN